jgi:hypothetical protein
MIIEQKTTEVRSNAHFASSEPMVIDADAYAHVYSSLTGMYSDEYSAVVRETVSNAYDSHILAGQTAPIEITLPTALNPNFIVKDFGVGMSRQELSDTYRKYGSTTKNRRNDQIGGFGFGAKAPLAIVAQFVVTSIKDGKKNVVLVAKGTDGIGAFNFFDELDTDEPNGVEISIPIPDTARLKRVMDGKIFIGFPNGSIKLDGKLITYTLDNSEVFTPVADSGWILDTELKNNHNRFPGNITALVGPVAYTIPREYVPRYLDNISFCGVYLKFDIGSVEVTPSREDLKYTDSTKAEIQRVADAYYKEFLRNQKAYIESSETHFDVVTRVTDFTKKFSNVQLGDLVWNGEPIPSTYAPIISPSDRKALRTGTTTYEPKTYRNKLEAKATTSLLSFKDFDEWRRRELSFFHIEDTLSKNIFIIEAGDTNNQGKFAVERIISSYVKNFVAKDRKDYGSYHVYVIPGSKDAISPWVIEGSLIVTANDIREAVKTVTPVKKVNKVPTPVVKNETSYPFIIIRESTAYEPEKLITASLKISDFAEDTKFIITKPESMSNNFEAFLALAARSSSRNQEFAITKAILNILNNAGYQLVSLTSTRSLENTIKAFPNNVTLEKAISDSITKIGELSDNEKDRLCNKNRISRYKSTHWTKVLFKNLDEFDKVSHLISHKNTRDWIRIGLNSKGNISRMSLLEDVKFLKENNNPRRYNRIIDLLPVLDKFLDELVLPSDTEGEIRYPLLEKISDNHDNVLELNEVIDYINFKDANSNKV